jgi:hypothetical protein
MPAYRYYLLPPALLALLCVLVVLATKWNPEPEQFRRQREACEADGGVVVAIEGSWRKPYACVKAELIYIYERK